MSDQTKPRIINELRATAQLMTLEPGVFCVFNQGPVLADANGLPGVRISLPPGPNFLPGSVRISTFREDGWLGGGNSAALIQVNGGQPGQVLVTVYQAQNGADAPRLQVVRLSDVPRPDAAHSSHVPPGAAVPRPPGVAMEKPSHPQPPAEEAEVAVHINRMGDVLALLGQWAGERGSQRWIEGFALSPKNDLKLADIEYQAVLGRDWLSPWSEGGQYCGSRGMSLPLLGLRVRLRGDAAERFDLALEASFVNGTTVGPVAAGQACETADLAALEAFKLSVTLKGQGTGPARRDKAAEPSAPEKASRRPTVVKPAIVKPGASTPVRGKPGAARRR